MQHREQQHHQSALHGSLFHADNRSTSGAHLSYSDLHPQMAHSDSISQKSRDRSLGLAISVAPQKTLHARSLALPTHAPGFPETSSSFFNGAFRPSSNPSTSFTILHAYFSLAGVQVPSIKRSVLQLQLPAACMRFGVRFNRISVRKLAHGKLGPIRHNSTINKTEKNR